MTVIGILYPGEMGAAIAEILIAQGRQVVTTNGNRSALTRKRCESAGISALQDLRSVSRAADLVLSVVPPKAVLPIAEAYADEAGAGAAPFVDLNAKGIADVAVLDAILAKKAIRFTNGCIIGQAGAMRQSGRIFVSGPHHEAVERAFEGVLPICDLGDEPERATAFKLAFAGFNKTIAAAMFETSIAAHGMGVFDALFAEIGRQLPGLISDFQPLIRTYPQHLRRRADEMTVLAGELSSQGLPHTFAAAAAGLFRRMDEQGALSDTASGADLFEVLREAH